MAIVRNKGGVSVYEWSDGCVDSEEASIFIGDWKLMSGIVGEAVDTHQHYVIGYHR